MKEKRFILASLVALALLSGCATGGKKIIGDGKLEPAAKTAVSLGASAASLAAPQYAGPIQAVADKIVAMGEEPKPATSEELVAAVMEAAGYTKLYTVYMDGIVINDFSRFTYRRAWEQTGTGATVDPVAMVESAAGTVPAIAEEPESALDARIDAAGEAIAAKKKAK